MHFMASGRLGILVTKDRKLANSNAELFKRLLRFDIYPYIMRFKKKLFPTTVIQGFFVKELHIYEGIAYILKISRSTAQRASKFITTNVNKPVQKLYTDSTASVVIVYISEQNTSVPSASIFKFLCDDASHLLG